MPLLGMRGLILAKMSVTKMLLAKMVVAKMSVDKMFVAKISKTIPSGFVPSHLFHSCECPRSSAWFLIAKI